MTKSDFEMYVQEYIELVNSKYDSSQEDFNARKTSLMNKAAFPFMRELMECIGWFTADLTHNEAIIREFEALFEFSFNPPQFDMQNFNFTDPWIREFQTRYLIFYERYYLSDQDLVQALIDIVCRRNYQIWHMRKAKEVMK